MERGRLLDVLDAAYDLNAPPDQWQARIVEGVQRGFAECDGVLSFRYLLKDGAPNLTSDVIGDPRYMAVPDDGHVSMDMQAIFRAYMAPSHAEPTTLFHADPETGQAPEALLRMWERHGVRDMFGVYATRALGESLTIGIALPRGSTPEIRAVDWRARRHAWGSVARHLENALVIRDVLARGPSADFELSGKGDFSGAAVEKREELVETARALEHHRDGAHQGNDESLDAWSRLLKGEWSIVRYQRDNGRMRYLAVENPEGDTLRALTALEADIVTRAAAGQPNKVMALELELHESTVANVLATGLRKLGLERRTHLPMLQRLLAGQR